MIRIRVIVLEIILFCLATALFTHLVPTSFQVLQSYELTGNIPARAETSMRLASSIRTELRSMAVTPDLIRSLRCRAMSDPRRYACSMKMATRSQVRRLQYDLRETLPSKVGWLKRREIESRLQLAGTQVGRWMLDIGLMEAELTELEPKLDPVKDFVNQEQKHRDTIYSKLDNRRRQLDILVEGFERQPKGNTQNLFLAKMAEVRKMISDLEVQLANSDQTIAELSTPLDRHQEIHETLPKLRAQVDLSRARMTSWSSVLASVSDAKIVANPEGFQLAAILTSKSLTPVRNWEHLFWSLPLGFFFFSIIRGRKLATWKEQFFHTPEEVTKYTNLKFLGEI